MTSRRWLPLAGLVLVAAALSGCVGEPEPVETTPAFASEQEAFAAAEETYRAYVDALNARMSGDIDSAPEAFLVGAALDAELKAQRELEAVGKSNSGVLSVAQVDVGGSQATSATINVCLDVSGTSVLDENGADVTPADRPLIVPLEVVAILASESVLIADINGYPDGFEC